MQVGELYQRRTPERLAEHLGPAGGAGRAAAPGRVIAGYAPPEHLCTARSNTSIAALVLQVTLRPASESHRLFYSTVSRSLEVPSGKYHQG